MHRIFTAVAALSLVLGLLLGFAGPASAVVAGYDSSYFGESAFLNLSTGQSGQFAVGFNNTGSTGWVKGSGSQVNLQVCLADKVTCGVASPNAAWASNWLSATAYATATTDFVGPGQTGWFVYNIVAPTNSAGVTARFNGDLALNATGQQVHPQGYYQDASVAGTTPPPGGGGGGSAVPSAVSSVTAANLREITVKFNTAMAQSGTGDATDPAKYQLGTNALGTVDIDGVRAVDSQTYILTIGRQEVATGTNFHAGIHMSANPATYLSQNGTYTLSVTNVATAGFALTGASNTTFTVNDSISPTASAPTVLGAYSFYITFSEPMDPTSTNNGITFDSQVVCGGTTVAQPSCNSNSTSIGIGNLHWQDRAGNDCAAGSLNGGCFQVLRVDFDKRRGTLPAAGAHTVDIRDATDAAGNKLSPNPTTFTVTLPGSSDTVNPTVTSVLAILHDGNGFAINVNFSEAMATTYNGYTSTDSVNCLAGTPPCPGTSGTNFSLRNPDGSAATTGGSSGVGDPIAIVSVWAQTDSQASTAVSARFKLQRVRLNLGPVGIDNGSGATSTPTLRPNTAYTIEVLNVKDEALNAIAPGTVKTFSWAGDSAAPTAVRAYGTTTKLMVDYSESTTSLSAASGTTNAANPLRYSSPNAAFQAAISSMTFTTQSNGNDANGVIFTFAQPVPAGTYELDISGVIDPFGNIISPNPTILTVTVGATTRPTLLCAGAGTIATPCVGVAATLPSSFGVKFSAQLQGGVAAASSAGNPSNYSINNGTFGSICATGSPTITGGPVANDGSQIFTVTCSGGGNWTPGVDNTVTVKDVQDLSGNTINPNPSTKIFQ